MLGYKRLQANLAANAGGDAIGTGGGSRGSVGGSAVGTESAPTLVTSSSSNAQATTVGATPDSAAEQSSPRELVKVTTTVTPPSPASFAIGSASTAGGPGYFAQSAEGKNRVTMEQPMRSQARKTWEKATASPMRSKETEEAGEIPGSPLKPSTSQVQGLTTNSPFVYQNPHKPNLVGILSVASPHVQQQGEGMMSPRAMKKAMLNLISLEGWLKKKGKEGIKLMRRWVSRWFQYHDLKLYYYLSKSDVSAGPSKAKGFIDLTLVEAIDEFGSSERFSGAAGIGLTSIGVNTEKLWYFDIVTPKRTYVLAAETETAYNKWVEQLRSILKLMEGLNEISASSSPTGNNNQVPPAVMGGHRALNEEEAAGGSPSVTPTPSIALQPTHSTPNFFSLMDSERMDSDKEEERTVYRLFREKCLPGEERRFMTSSVGHVSNTGKRITTVGRLFITNYRIMFIPSPRQSGSSKNIEADPDTTNVPKEAKLELFSLVEAGDWPGFKKVLSNITTNIDEQKAILQKLRNPYTNYCLLSTAVEYRQERFIEECIAHGCLVNRPDDKGFTPFLTACVKGDLECCVLLLRKGAAVNLPTKDDCYPLHYLVRLPWSSSLEDVLHLLFKHGVDVDATNMNGETALHLAVDPATIELLLDHNANINAVDGRGETCLHKVISRAPQKEVDSIVKTVQMLIARGADLTIYWQRLVELIETFHLSALKPMLLRDSMAPSDRPISLSGFALGRPTNLRVQKISIPLMMIESVREHRKSQSIDIMTKNVRLIRFVFDHPEAVKVSEKKALLEAERKAFIEAIRQYTPKAPKDIFAFPYAQHRVEPSWNQKDIDIYTWDSNNSMPSPLGISHRNFVSFAAGRTHVAAISTEGDVWVWGTGTGGQLGLGGIDRSWNPKRIASGLEGRKAKRIFCGSAQTAIITEENELYHWGTCGREPVSIPTPVRGFHGRRVLQVALGTSHICALVQGETNTALVHTWGSNNIGQLGHGDTIDRWEPTPVKSLGGLQLVASGPFHVVAITDNRLMYHWGRSLQGSDGSGFSSSPVLVESLSGKTVRDVSCGNDFTVVVLQNGEVYSWGDGKRGTLGHGDYESSPTPRLIEKLVGKGVQRVVCGNRHTVAHNDVSLWAWGSLVQDTGLIEEKNVPQKIKSLAARRIFQVACGWRQSLAMVIEDPFDLLAEFRRQGVPNCYWRLTTLNAKYAMCPSYPQYVLVPQSLSDDTILEASRFRTQGRLPCLTYKHSKNHATITRSSQPSVGLAGRRSPEDERLLRCIVEANPQSDGMLYILDARPKANAVANQAVGAGYEHSDYYKNLKIQFLGIENIHLMRESLHKLCNICRQKKFREDKVSSNWLSELEATHWIDHIVTILSATGSLIELLSSGKSAHVHCSDGWDRTTQLVSLAQLMLDPYFRTIRGFQVLIEKDWIRFGHRFGDRQGHFPETSGSSQVSPIFLQFLDCVWQCTRQFPTCFEFNTHFLVKLFDHSHSGKYSNFFCNSDRERKDLHRKVMLGASGETQRAGEKQRAFKGSCLWQRMQEKEHKYRNPDYLISAKNDELMPLANLKAVRLWREFFFRWETPCK